MPGMLAAALLASLTAHATDDRVPSPERAPTVREPSDREAARALRSPELAVEVGAGVMGGHVGVGVAL